MNFQPALWEDNSLKVSQLPPMGYQQFDPIYNFSSIDVHARALNPMCISDIREVAKFERLLKFGRPGWWAIYRHYPQKNMLQFAGVKLTGFQNLYGLFESWQGKANANDKTKLRLLSVLTPRLAVTAGPYTREAAEQVASHLAIVVGTDHHRHFLSTTYPSEPIVAAASANLIQGTYGWANALSVLASYIQTGIVDVGFRGELLTKILCLMAVDKSMSASASAWPASTYWQYAIPVKVSVFLDNLIAPHPTFKSFTDAIHASPLNDERINRFLDGYVFFNHFLRMEEALTMRVIVQAWNRGAALQCKTNTALIDHVIPVMLAQPDGLPPPKFGPLYDDWNERQVDDARQHVSYIVINSRNFTDPKNWTTTYITANKSNILDCESPMEVPNNKLTMTILQEFGPPQAQEEHITIFPSRGKKKPVDDTTQLHVILKELCSETYTALKTPYIHPLAQEYLETLRIAKSIYHENNGDSKSVSISHDNMPIVFGDYTSLSKQTWRAYSEDHRMQTDWAPRTVHPRAVPNRTEHFRAESPPRSEFSSASRTESGFQCSRSRMYGSNSIRAEPN